MTDDVRLGIATEYDDSGARAVEQDLKRQKDQTDALGKSLDRSGDAADDLTKALSDARRNRALQQIADDAGQGRISIEQAVAALRELGATDKEIQRVGRSIEQIADGIARAEQEARTLQGQLKLADDLNSRVRRDVGIVGDVETGARSVGGAIGAFGGGGAERIIAQGSEIFAAAEGLAQLRAAAGGLGPVLTNLISTIGIGGAGLIAGFVALGVAVKVFGDRAKEAREQAERAAEGIRAAYEFQGTTGDLASRRQEIQQQIEDLQQLSNRYVTESGRLINQANESTDSFEDVTDTFARGLDRIGIELGDRAGADAFEQKAREVNEQIEELTSELETLNDPLVANRAAARAAAEAQRELNEQYEAMADRQTEVLRATTLFLSQQDLTTEQIDERRAQIARERAAIEAALQVQAISEDARNRYLDQLNSLYIEEQLLTGQAVELVAARQAEREYMERMQQFIRDNEQAAVDAITRRYELEEQLRQVSETATAAQVAERLSALNRERDAIRDQIDELSALDNAFGANTERIEQLQDRLQTVNEELQLFGADAIPAVLQNAATTLAADVAKIQERAAANIANVNAKLKADLDKIAESLRTAQLNRDKRLADAERTAVDSRLKALQSFQQASIELERDTAEQRQKILRDSERSIRNAVAQRDALAAFQAMQARDGQLEELDKEAAARSEKIAEQYAQQTAQIEAALIEQRRRVNEQYRQQVSDANAAAQAARAAARQQVDTIRQQASAEIQIRQQAFTTQLNQLSQWASGSSQIIQRFVQNTLSSLGALSANGGASFNTNVPLTLNLNGGRSGGLSSGQRSEVVRTVNDTLYNAFDRIRSAGSLF